MCDIDIENTAVDNQRTGRVAKRVGRRGSQLTCGDCRRPGIGVRTGEVDGGRAGLGNRAASRNDIANGCVDDRLIEGKPACNRDIADQTRGCIGKCESIGSTSEGDRISTKTACNQACKAHCDSEVLAGDAGTAGAIGTQAPAEAAKTTDAADNACPYGYCCTSRASHNQTDAAITASAANNARAPHASDPTCNRGPDDECLRYSSGKQKTDAAIASASASGAHRCPAHAACPAGDADDQRSKGTAKSGYCTIAARTTTTAAARPGSCSARAAYAASGSCSRKQSSNETMRTATTAAAASTDSANCADGSDCPRRRSACASRAA